MKTIPLSITPSVDAKLTIVSDDHVFIAVDHGTPVTINRVPVCGRLDLYLWSDQTWRQHPEWADGEYTLRSGYAPGSPRRAEPGSFSDAPDATAKKFHELLTDAVNDWYRDSPWASSDLADAGSEQLQRLAKELLGRAEQLEDNARAMRREAEYIRDGGRIIYYIKDRNAGRSETRKAIVTAEGECIDTVEQPEDSR